MVGDDDESFEDGSRSSESFIDYKFQMIKENNPSMTSFCADGDDIQNITDDGWEELGRDISNNTHLKNVYLCACAIDDHKMSFLFEGLTRSSSIEYLELYSNQFQFRGVQSMVPFLQNADNLQYLDVSHNLLQSRGFNVLFQSIRNSPIKELHCSSCGIESIEIDSENIPKHLERLHLVLNDISNDGCREVAKFLQVDNSTLESLHLSSNNIDDAGVEILVDSLRNNTSLKRLDLRGNDRISTQGQILLLKLVNDVSSIEATLRSNHTLTNISVKVFDPEATLDASFKIQRHIDEATAIMYAVAARAKVISMQLHSAKRAELAALQGVDHSVYSEIDPLHLPEVLSLIGRHHGQGELYMALLSSIMTILSTVNVMECIQQERAYHVAIAAEHEAIAAEHRIKIEELDARIVSMGESSKGKNSSIQLEHRSNKRPRK